MYKTVDLLGGKKHKAAMRWTSRVSEIVELITLYVCIPPARNFYLKMVLLLNTEEMVVKRVGQ